MKLEIKEIVVAALRSSNYRQGRGNLHPTGDTFCCLGVIYDLHAKAGLGSRVGSRYETSKGDDSCILLPPAVAKWAGLSSLGGITPDGRSLWKLNDVEELSFSQIAYVIEYNADVL